MLVSDLQWDMLPPAPESGNGLSLAHNSAFATIARSMLPPCVFDSTRETCTLLFNFAPVSRAPVVSAISTPREAVSSPPDRSVLASDGAAYMTGHTLVLSGGVVML